MPLVQLPQSEEQRQAPAPEAPNSITAPGKPRMRWYSRSAARRRRVALPQASGCSWQTRSRLAFPHLVSTAVQAELGASPVVASVGLGDAQVRLLLRLHEPVLGAGPQHLRADRTVILWHGPSSRRASASPSGVVGAVPPLNRQRPVDVAPNGCCRPRSVGVRIIRRATTPSPVSQVETTVAPHHPRRTARGGREGDAYVVVVTPTGPPGGPVVDRRSTVARPRRGCSSSRTVRDGATAR